MGERMGVQNLDAMSPHEASLDPRSTELAKSTEEERMTQWSLIQLDWAKTMCLKASPKLSDEELMEKAGEWLSDDEHSDWFRNNFKLNPERQELIKTYKKDRQGVLDYITDAWDAAKH